jgi:flagellin
MGINTSAAGKSMEKLSSGLRINRAADDAAGLSISEKMRGQIRGLDQANKNVQDGVSYIQTAEGALNEVSSMLVRMKELTVQKANGTFNSDDTDNLKLEMEQLGKEINNVLTKTEFNGKNVFAGTVSIVISDADTDTFAIGIQVTDPTLNSTSLTANIETAITSINTARSTFGAHQNRLEHISNNLANTSENLTAAESRIRDTDMAKEMMTFSKNNILQQAAQAMLAQANQQPQGVLQLLR